MTTTTPTLLPGVHLHRDRYRVRVMFPAPYGRHIEMRDNADDANALALELRRRRDAGLPPNDGVADPTLRQAADALLARKASAVSRKTKRPLSANGRKHWDISTRPWREGPHADVPLSLLRRDRLEDVVLALAAEHPTTARNALESLKATLRYAGDRGARFDLALLGIEAVVVEPRVRRALTIAQLDFLVAHVPAYARRLVLFLATTGLRCEEAFTLTDDRVNLGDASVSIPAPFNKEGRDKVVPLTPEEVALVREQLGVLHVVDAASPTAHLPSRAAGTDLVWPKAQGGRWSTSRPHFHKLVWSKATTRAAAAWREDHNLGADDATPFDDLKPHDLRATAATLMRDAGLSKDDAADRLGHADTSLLDNVYDQGDRAARVARGLAAAAPDGLRAAAARLAITPGAPTTATAEGN